MKRGHASKGGLGRQSQKSKLTHIFILTDAIPLPRPASCGDVVPLSACLSFVGAVTTFCPYSCYCSCSCFPSASSLALSPSFASSTPCRRCKSAAQGANVATHVCCVSAMSTTQTKRARTAAKKLTVCSYIYLSSRPDRLSSNAFPVPTTPCTTLSFFRTHLMVV